ncbi:hypothetical protein BV898_00642 [Hypsibius exemplaris]|uniref:Uncharacterized protein n=1 Tax=Hypsibius exemplaris TaxID=2072580 RepID=A0A1W0XEC2_HYPEX|nr:hypothetical protein BV898_00642 [Hypsibius exemplaris]
MFNSFEISLRRPRTFLVLSGVELYLALLYLLLLVFALGYGVHDPLINLVPWYKWVLKCAEICDTVCMIVAGRAGRSAALMFRMDSGPPHRRHLIRSLIFSLTGIIVSITILVIKGSISTRSGWTLFDESNKVLNAAAITLLFLFLVLKIGVQFICLALCITVHWDDVRAKLFSGQEQTDVPLQRVTSSRPRI